MTLQYAMKAEDKKLVVELDKLVRELIHPGLKPSRLNDLSKVLLMIALLPNAVMQSPISITFTATEDDVTETVLFASDEWIVLESTVNGQSTKLYVADVGGERVNDDAAKWLAQAKAVIAKDKDAWYVRDESQGDIPWELHD